MREDFRQAYRALEKQWKIAVCTFHKRQLDSWHAHRIWLDLDVDRSIALCVSFRLVSVLIIKFLFFFFACMNAEHLHIKYTYIYRYCIHFLMMVRQQVHRLSDRWQRTAKTYTYFIAVRSTQKNYAKKKLDFHWWIFPLFITFVLCD